MSAQQLQMFKMMQLAKQGQQSPPNASMDNLGALEGRFVAPLSGYSYYNGQQVPQSISNMGLAKPFSMSSYPPAGTPPQPGKNNAPFYRDLATLAVSPATLITKKLLHF